MTIEDRVLAELYRLQEHIEEAVGLHSRWNGSIALLSAPEMVASRGKLVFAEKEWTCGMLLLREIADRPVRWRSMLHELLHSCSTGCTISSYGRYIGWEEGVVESCQRLLRPTILDALGEQVNDSVFVELEENWTYNRYITALELVRERLEASPTEFYIGLLGIPLSDRPNHILKRLRAVGGVRVYQLVVRKLETRMT